MQPWRSCPRASSYAPILTMALLGLSALMILRHSSVAMNPSAAACFAMLFLAFTSQLNYTIVIPDSYPLAEAMRSGAAYSGQMIGIYKPGSCAGSFVTWLLLRSFPDVWRKRPKGLLVSGLATSTVGAALYCVLVCFVGSTPPSRALPALFLVSRFVTGVGAGLVMQLTFVSMARLTPAPGRPDQMARLQLFNTLGIAAGPFMDSVLRLLQMCPNGPLAFWMDGTLQLVLLGTGLLGTCAYYPRLVNVKDHMAEPPVPPASSEGSAAPAEALVKEDRSSEGASMSSRRIVIVGSIVMTMARAVSVAGVEAAAVMLLQRDYAWEESAVGMAVGLTFLTAIPLKLCHGIGKEYLCLESWIRLLAVVGILGSMLFFSASGSGVTLLGATAVVFPTMYLSDALSLGAMQQHCLPDGSWLDANHTMLWFNLCVNGAGHFAGPILARYCVEKGGQGLFAWQQLALSVFFWFMFEAVVRPSYLLQGKKPKLADGRPRLGTF